MNEMRSYRIVSDGIRWRVQRLYFTRFRKKPKWDWLGVRHPEGDFTIFDYDSLEEAEKALASSQRKDEARAQGYKIVKEYGMKC